MNKSALVELRAVALLPLNKSTFTRESETIFRGPLCYIYIGDTYIYIYTYKILRLAALRLLILFRLPQPEAKVKVSKRDRSYMEGTVVFLTNIPRSRKILRLAALRLLILFLLPQPEAKVKASKAIDLKWREFCVSNIPRSRILNSKF